MKMKEQNNDQKEAQCVKTQTQIRCGRFLVIVSIMNLAIGIVLIAFGYVLLDNLNNDIKITSFLTNILQSRGQLQSTVTLIAGIIQIFVSVLGLLTQKFMKPYISCPFILLSIICGIICLISAGAVLQSNIQTQYVQDVCNTPLFIYNYQTGQQAVQQEYGLMVDKFMCSSVCPCPSQFQSIWTSLGEATLRQYYRSFQLTSQESALATDPVKSKLLTTVTQLVFKDSSQFTTYSTYQQCFQQIQNNPPLPTDDSDYQKYYNSFVTKNNYNFYQSIEQNGYSCAGLCYQPLFYISKNISQGIPPSECLGTVLQNYKNSYGIGVIAIIASFLLISGGIAGVPLCTNCDKSKKKEESEDEDQ